MQQFIVKSVLSLIICVPFVPLYSMELIESKKSILPDGTIEIASNLAGTIWYQKENSLSKSTSDNIPSNQVFPVVQVIVAVDGVEPLKEFCRIPVSHLWSLKTGDCIKFGLHSRLEKRSAEEISSSDEAFLYNCVKWTASVLRPLTTDEYLKKHGSLVGYYTMYESLGDRLKSKILSYLHQTQYAIEHKIMADRTLMLTCKCDYKGISFENTLKKIVQDFANINERRIWHYFENEPTLFWELVGNNIRNYQP